MKTLFAALIICMTTGCSTMFNDRIQDVSVISEPSGAHYKIKNQYGEQVASGVTPDNIKLDAAAGFFDGEKYQVSYEKDSKRAVTVLDSDVTGWYWLGMVVWPFTSGLIVDPLMGDMYSLPDEVKGVLR